METPRLEQFKELARDYSIIRLNGKRPLERNWEQYSLSKRAFEAIDFKAGDNAGIACGPASGVIVLDIDNEALFQQAQKKPGWAVPETRTIRTGSGGTHYYFRYPDDGDHYGNRAFKGYGFDIRGTGGQVVAPGSVHPKTGKHYEVERGVPVADAPEWLLELAGRKAGSTSGHREKWDKSFAPVELEPVNLDSLELTPHIKTLIEEGQPEGKRSEAIWAVLKALVSARITDGQIISIFEKYQIGEKYLDQGESRQSWLLPQISKAKVSPISAALPALECATLPDMDHGTIPPEAFVQTMEQRWTEELGNVTSESLRQTWKQLAEAFNFNISSHDDAESRNRWLVVQPATGTGKTQGAITYCLMLSELAFDWLHPGALIVTRLIEDANQIATQINELVGREVALAHHSDSGTKLMALGAWPVLVITHKAYELALDFLGQEGTIQQTWPFFHEYNGGRRKLVVIDECLDIVEHSQMDLDRLRATVGAIPEFIREDFPQEMEAISCMTGIMEQLSENLRDTKTMETMALKDAVSQGTPPDFAALRKAIRERVRFDKLVLGKQDLYENERQKKRHDEVLRNLHWIFRSWMYYAKVDTKHAFHTARLLVPEDVKGAVVLDATASSNVVYQLFKDAWPLQPPEGARNYGNFTLHISRGHRVGKGYMEDNAAKLSETLVADLSQRIAGRNAFVVTHKGVEASLAGYELPFEMNTGHWGKVDGSNQWRDCDTVVVFGVQYMPDSWTANTYMAHQGVQDTEWLRHSEARAYKEHPDIRRALKMGQMVTSVVQAINRVQCRKVIDAQGSCPVTEGYMLLPADSVADELLKGIKREMPGVQVTEDWDFGSQKTKKRIKKSKHDEALLKHLENMQDGRLAKSTLCKLVGIPERSMDRFISRCKEADSGLADSLHMLGVRLEVKRGGKNPTTYFVKG